MKNGKMKRRNLIISMLLCFCLLSCFVLAGCGTADNGDNGSDVQGTSGAIVNEGLPEVGDGEMICRVIDKDDGTLLLAKKDGESSDVYTLDLKNVSVTLSTASGIDLEEGCLVKVAFDSIEEVFPGILNASSVEVLESGFDDMCEMYLNVFEDIWEKDGGLNAGIIELGVDLSNTRLSAAEQSAVAYVFGMEHGILPLQGTWEELCEQGYIDKENLVWENGCLFSIEETGDGDAADTYGQSMVTFNAKKWRSGLGAYYFDSCTSVQSRDGEWEDYEIGVEAIS